MKLDKTLKHRNGRNILYIELKSPFPELLKQLAERENRSMKAQAEVIVMERLRELEALTTTAEELPGAA